MNQHLEMVECPKCHIKISKLRLSRHLKKAHNPDIEHAKSKAVIAGRKKKIDSEKIVTCPICNCLIKNKNLSRHGQLKHKLFPSQISGVNKFKNSREKEAFWKKKLGPEIEEESNDVFSKGIVLSGGAYGLGKNRNN